MVRTLPVFSQEQYRKAHKLLAARVAYMLGRKFEEGDWADVYCSALGIPKAGWSNLQIDIMHGNLGVEHKMLGRKSDKPITECCGTALMHPAATRALRIGSLDRDPDVVMQEVFRQYAELIQRRAAKVRENAMGEEPDLRTGWLLWQRSLVQFLYFEEPMIAPDPKRYYAEWNTRLAGVRLGSKNLWIYDRDSGHKRFSVTTEAGIKLQPYFDVPPVTADHLYVFTVQGEEVGDGLIRVWLTASTAREAEKVIGSLDTAVISQAILVAEAPTRDEEIKIEGEQVVDLLITAPAYSKLGQDFEGVSDEHRFRLFLSSITG